MGYISLISPFIAAFLTLLITRFNEVSKKCDKDEVIKHILINTLNGLACNMIMLNEQLLKIAKSPVNTNLYAEAKFLFLRQNLLNNINKDDLNSFIIEYMKKDIDYFISFESLMEYLNYVSSKEVFIKKNLSSNGVFEKYIDDTYKQILINFNITDKIKNDLKQLPKLNSIKRKIYKSIF